MNRRNFLSGLATVGVASLGALKLRGENAAPDGPLSKAAEPWLFWDLWHVELMSNLEHRQGRPRWRADSVYTANVADGLASWPTVYRDADSGTWRMFHSSEWKPYALHVAESDDGLHFRPRPVPDAKPEGGQKSPNHVFTLPHGSAGAVYVDPAATDGFRFRAFAHQQQEPVAERAAKTPGHRWHAIAKAEGTKRYLTDELTLVSRDGLYWEARFDRGWGLPDWHPEPPIFGFYNRHQKRHAMTVRPGWGDRRVCLQSTADFRKWSGPEMLVSPDPQDGLVEHYGMPVFPHGKGYVGLLWVFHCETAVSPKGFNRFIGHLDCQLTYSQDGVRFQRGLRESFIARNAMGEPGGGAIQASSLVETDDEIRIYSASSKLEHGRRREGEKRGVQDSGAILVHTLRKDGFMYLTDRGYGGEFLSKPLTLLDADLTLNARAPFGEVEYQITDMAGHPVEGFTFADCQPLKSADSLRHPLRWKGQPPTVLLNKVARLHVRLRHAEVFAIRGRFHFLDAQDAWMLADGKTIDTRMFDF